MGLLVWGEDIIEVLYKLFVQYGEGKVGITGRNNMGLLVWGENAVETEQLNLGKVFNIWTNCEMC